jgi:hypothetical protein
MTGEEASLVAAAPDMARALGAIMGRVAEAGRAMPRERSAEEMVASDTDIPVPAALLRDALAALKKAGVLP